MLCINVQAQEEKRASFGCVPEAKYGGEHWSLSKKIPRKATRTKNGRPTYLVSLLYTAYTDTHVFSLWDKSFQKMGGETYGTSFVIVGSQTAPQKPPVAPKPNLPKRTPSRADNARRWAPAAYGRNYAEAKRHQVVAEQAPPPPPG